MSYAFNIVRANNAIIDGIRAPLFDRRELSSAIGVNGNPYQTSHAVLRTAPMARFSTIAVRSVLALLSPNAEAPADVVPWVALDGTNGLELIGGIIATAGPGWQGGSVHARRQFLNGILVLDGLDWSAGGVVEATVSAYARATAGGTDPVVSTAVALPTLPSSQEQCGLTTLTHGAIDLLPRAARVSVAIAHRVENNVDPGCYAGSLPHPTLLMGPGPGGPAEITATVETLDLVTALGGTGTALTMVFSVANHLGVGYGASTATVVLNASLAREETVEGQDGAPARRRLIYRASFDGTNRPMTTATA